MNIIILNILIGLCAALIGILAFADEISQVKKLNFFKSLRFKIIALISISIIGIWATVEKDSNINKQNQKEKDEAEIDQQKRDSANRVFANESNTKIILTFTEALAKYGLKYDSTKMVIEKLVKDSSIRNVTVINGADPVLMLCSSTESSDIFYRNDTLFIMLRLCSEKSTSKVKELKLTVIGRNGDYENSSDDNFKLIAKDDVIEGDNSQIESTTITLMQLKYPHVYLYFNMIFLRIFGTYTNFDNSKKFKIDLIYGYDLKNKKFGTATQIPNDKIRKFLSY